ncbi:MAG: hypothetical protein LBV27_06255 [Oscillospiraceae bacterium]|nr:hypothetical protein [Oscillospiraceae bacterium]
MWELECEIEGNNCYNSMLFLLLKCFKRDDLFLYLNKYYNHYYTNRAGLLAERLDSNYPRPNPDVLRDYCGVDVRYTDSAPDIRRVISEAIQKAPVGVTLDPYDCGWTPHYRRAHYNHFCFVVGLSKNDTCICKDIYFSKCGYIEIPFAELALIYQYIYTFEFLPFEPPDKESHINFLTGNINALSERNTDEERRQLKEYLNSRFELKEEIPDLKYLETSALLLKLMWFAEDKRMFIAGLKTLSGRFPGLNYDSVYRPLRDCVQAFVNLRSVLIKSLIKKDVDRRLLSTIIDEIYDCDRRVIKAMRKKE